MLARHLGVMLPVSLALALLPGQWWLRLLVAGMALSGSMLTVLVSAVDIRTSRLRQHRLPTPDDPPRDQHG
jgi:hypothetical protein